MSGDEDIGSVGVGREVGGREAEVLTPPQPGQPIAEANGEGDDTAELSGVAPGEAGPVRRYTEPFKKIQAMIDRQYTEPFKNIQAMIDRQYTEPFKNIQAMLDIARRLDASHLLLWPANLRRVPGISLAEVTVVVMDEGIPLYAVPRTSTAEALLSASTYSERRTIIGNRWRSIASDCESVLHAVQSPALRGDAAFALRVASAMRDGHADAAQALAANLLDSMVRAHFTADRVVLMPSSKVRTPDGYEDFIALKYLAVAPIWRAFQSFFPSNGDQVPRSFARHASAHAVVRRQFSKRNAIQALMLVTGLLAFLETHGVG